MASIEENTIYFESVPWCVELLQDESFTSIDTISRKGKATRGDDLFARTLATDDTIPAFLTQYKPVDTTTHPRATSASDRFEPRVKEVRCLIALAAGLNGYPGILHGGMVACIVDEVTGLLTGQNHRLQHQSPRPGHDLPPWTTVTGELTVKYRRPVMTGQVVLARAWFDNNKLDGSKYSTKAVIQDSAGQVLCQSIVTFVGIKPGREGAFKSDRIPKL